MKQLLQHDFFAEHTGIKVELVNKDAGGGGGVGGGAGAPAGGAGGSESSEIQLWLRVVDPRKRKKEHKENEAIQFDYNIDKDDAEQVAHEMVRRLSLAVRILLIGGLCFVFGGLYFVFGSLYFVFGCLYFGLMVCLGGSYDLVVFCIFASVFDAAFMSCYHVVRC